LPSALPAANEADRHEHSRSERQGGHRDQRQRQGDEQQQARHRKGEEGEREDSGAGKDR
jgi:hypothetical protein